MDFSPGALFGSFVFSVIGFSLFRYAKKNHKSEQMIIGAVMMAYSYFTPNAWMTWAVGLALSLAAYYFH